VLFDVVVVVVVVCLFESRESNINLKHEIWTRGTVRRTITVAGETRAPGAYRLGSRFVVVVLMMMLLLLLFVC